MTHSIQISVVDPDAATDTDGDTDGDSDTDGTATGVTASGTTGTDPTEGMDTDETLGEDTEGPGATDDGCGCSTAPAEGPAALLGGLLLLGFARRRR